MKVRVGGVEKRMKKQIFGRGVSKAAILVLLGLVSQTALGQSYRVTGEPPKPQNYHNPSNTDAADWSRTNLDKLLAPVFINKMADFYVAGAAISIVKDGELKYARGFGYSDVFAQERVKADRTIFRIGSVTKTLTGLALLQLVDQGKVDLNADVRTYLSDVRIDNKYSKPVTVRHLLTHTASFDQFGYGRHVSKREDEKSLADFLKNDLTVIREPGVLSCYDTYGITLAGHLVEKITGLSYEEYLTKHIFDPLEMHRSNIHPHKSLARDTAIGYGFTGSWNPERWEFMNTAPASTVNSTVTDMSRYMITLLNGGEFNGKRLLSEKLTRVMLERQHTNVSRLVGFGYTFWEDRKFGIAAFSHGGSMTGFGSLLYLVPEENFGVYITYNQESSRLANVVVKTLVDKFFAHRKIKRQNRARIDADVEQFTGTYANNLYNHSRPDRGGWRMRTTEVTATDKNGELKFGGSVWQAVEPLVFQRDDGELLVFRKNRDGKISHMLLRQDVYERLSDKDIQAYKEASKPKVVKIEQKILERYAGDYKTPEGTIAIRSAAGYLEIVIPGREVQKLYPNSETSFFSTDRPVRLVFQVDSSGKVLSAVFRAGNSGFQLVKVEGKK